jgi:hypothetical protein
MTFEQEMSKFWATFSKAKLRPAIEDFPAYKDAINAQNAEVAERIACWFLDNKPNSRDTKQEKRSKRERQKLVDDYEADRMFRLLHPN